MPFPVLHGFSINRFGSVCLYADSTCCVRCPHTEMSSIARGKWSGVVRSVSPVYVEYLMPFVWCKQHFGIFTLSRCLFFFEWLWLQAGARPCSPTNTWQPLPCGGNGSSLLNISFSVLRLLFFVVIPLLDSAFFIPSQTLLLCADWQCLH